MSNSLYHSNNRKTYNTEGSTGYNLHPGRSDLINTFIQWSPLRSSISKLNSGVSVSVFCCLLRQNISLPTCNITVYWVPDKHRDWYQAVSTAGYLQGSFLFLPVLHMLRTKMATTMKNTRSMIKNGLSKELTHGKLSCPSEVHSVIHLDIVDVPQKISWKFHCWILFTW